LSSPPLRKTTPLSNYNGSSQKGLKSYSLLLRNGILFVFFILGGLLWKSHWPEVEKKSAVNVIPKRPSNLALISKKKSEPKEQKATNSHDSLKAKEGHTYHLIFSTDCSDYQDWQSYLLFHSALKIKQPGYVTRIASGCKDEDKARKWHKDHIQSVMNDRFRLHLTPHFSGVKNEDGDTVGDYKFFNKPYGLKHWMEHGDTIGIIDSEDGKVKNEDDIVILVDPDMILLRPITEDFSIDREVVISKRKAENRKFKVKHGQPFAQTYGFGAQWNRLNLTEIAGENSPAIGVTQQEGLVHYPVGPPYLATVRDMYAISKKWAEFVPKVHKEYPHLLAEMFAFCIAAAHLELPHQMIDSLMISNTGAGGEGWPMIDKIPIDGMCEFAKNPDHKLNAVPSVIHYCQRYMIGDWFFSKRKMLKNFFECRSPLMKVPPGEIIKEVDYKKPPGGGKKLIGETERKREGFVVCGIISALNDASKYFKKNHCSPGNLEETLDLAHQA